MVTDALAGDFARGIEKMGLSLDGAAQQKLLEYLRLLAKWNRAYNLTAVRNIEDMLPRHLLDSLSVSPYLVGDRVLDVGTGPGLPGIPLSITYPERQFTLLDSNGKKTRFLHQAVVELKLTNIRVCQSRIEAFVDAEPFDAILSRAFSTLLDMVKGCYELCAAGGYFLAMKGVYPQQELEELLQHYPQLEVESVLPLNVPESEGERHLVVLRKPSA
ncbi:16S rRNA (guanine(527)-N(7))-methyltransferase RsmG [Aestuariirhabdus litorea]|uniref:Ribosomal RNA small subunit methyltransferase G n=1 Tax=Aestuariirhabdus litorea TaxID=2528527 RepID=A0A3P3VJW5_9GAMM|nr:16S rRNA (guanine(527)-N(7))-methyltransferase RsmG [Aestuariirhabdus litorea]RRJ82617.1 16S rRNA (guanine(527)-N(7))-methyltransferase RsmG [Aestuariirhabdus litorea]RWW92777.1 16S rRNA (guanine(527)-N(7))-methyltransferase RsmG [Endozoicomonadaceae bacterium GTF-13]